MKSADVLNVNSNDLDQNLTTNPFLVHSNQLPWTYIYESISTVTGISPTIVPRAYGGLISVRGSGFTDSTGHYM